MLLWNELSPGARISGILLLIVFFIGGPLAVMGATSFANKLTVFGGMLCGVSVVLHPLAFKAAAKDFSAGIAFQNMPLVCKAIGGLGLTCLLSGSVLGLLI